MKPSNLFYLGALSALVLTGCKSNDDNSEWMTDGVVFTSHIEGMASRASGTAWSDGDQVGIFMTAGGTDYENRQYTASSDGNLTPAGQALKYPEEGTADFFAYYPYQTSISNKTYAVNVSDQSDPTKIDLLYATQTGVGHGDVVNFGFTHELSQIVINITKDETINSLSELTIKASGMNTQADFMLGDGTLNAKDSKTDFDMNVKVDGETATAEAIVIPTADLTGAKLVFTLNGIDFTWDMTVSGGGGFVKGTKYTYNAILSTGNGQPSVNMGNASIDDWTDQAGGNINVDFGDGTQTGGETVVLDASFANDMSGFTIDEVSNTASENIWIQDPSFGNISAKAYIDGQNHASESWLISPVIDLTSATSATLSFEHALGYAYGQGPTNQTLQIKKEGEENWTQLSFTYPDEDNASAFISSGNIDLKDYAGAKVQIAFKYISTTENAATWRIKNLKVVANGNSGTVEPDPEPTPGEETVIFEEKFGTPVQGSYWPSVDVYDGWDNTSLTFSDPYMSGSYSRANVRSTSSLDGHVWFSANYTSALNISNIDTSNYTNLKLTYKVSGNAAGTADLLNVTCGSQTMTVPTTTFEQNKYIEIELTNLPDNITSIEFKADASTNTIGLRLDDVKLTGVAK